MSWSEIKKAVNDDLNIPLNKLVGEYINSENGEKAYLKNTYEKTTIKNYQVLSDMIFFTYENSVHAICAETNHVHYILSFDGTWTVLDNLPLTNTAKLTSQCVEFNGYIYCFYEGTLFKYKQGQWESKSAGVNIAYAGAVVYNDELYVFGVREGGSGNYNNYGKFDKNDNYTHLGTLPLQRPSAFIYAGIYKENITIGFYNDTSGYSFIVQKLENNTFTDIYTFSNYSNSDANVSVAFTNDHIYLFGISYGSYYRGVLSYSDQGQTWLFGETNGYCQALGRRSASAINNNTDVLFSLQTSSNNASRVWRGTGLILNNQLYPNTVYGYVLKTYLIENGSDTLMNPNNLMLSSLPFRIKSIQYFSGQYANNTALAISVTDPTKCVVLITNTCSTSATGIYGYSDFTNKSIKLLAVGSSYSNITIIEFI